MSSPTIVRDQAELNAALADAGITEIAIDAPRRVRIVIDSTNGKIIQLRGETYVGELRDTSSVEWMRDTSRVEWMRDTSSVGSMGDTSSVGSMGDTKIGRAHV